MHSCRQVFIDGSQMDRRTLHYSLSVLFPFLNSRYTVQIQVYLYLYLKLTDGRTSAERTTAGRMDDPKTMLSAYYLLFFVEAWKGDESPNFQHTPYCFNPQKETQYI